MNTQKYKVGNLGLLGEADRTMYKDKDTVSKSIIDPARTHLNYNVCPHPQYKAWEVKAMNEKIRGKKMPKNGVAWGSTIISLPKDYTGSTEEFFNAAYEGLKKLYKLRDEDIISAYVHMDETTPHMHFYFVPVVHEETKDRVSWETVMPRKMYKTQHKRLQAYMVNQLGTAVNLLNGETKGIDVQNMTAQQKQASMALEEMGKQLAEMDKQLDAKGKQLKELDAAQTRFKTSLSEWVESHNGLQRVLRAAPRLSQPHRDKISSRMEQAVSRGDAVLSDALDDVDSILRAAAELERGKRTFDAGRKAVKNNLDIDELLADDDFELC